jgi:hypothetical protein
MLWYGCNEQKEKRKEKQNTREPLWDTSFKKSTPLAFWTLARDLTVFVSSRETKKNERKDWVNLRRTFAGTPNGVNRVF